MPAPTLSLRLHRFATPLLAMLLSSPVLAMQSPWWENYDQRDEYICPRKGPIVLERNDSQASLLNDGVRSTFFREPSSGLGVRYRNDRTTLILRGDELTVEQLPQRLVCVRTADV